MLFIGKHNFEQFFLLTSESPEALTLRSNYARNIIERTESNRFVKEEMIKLQPVNRIDLCADYILKHKQPRGS